MLSANKIPALLFRSALVAGSLIIIRSVDSGHLGVGQVPRHRVNGSGFLPSAKNLLFYVFFYSLKFSPCCKDLGATCHTGRVAKPFVTRVLQAFTPSSYQSLNEMPLTCAGVKHLWRDESMTCFLPSFLTPMFLPILECFFVNILFQSRAELVEEYQSRLATREQNKMFVHLPVPSAITEKCC